MEWNEAVRVAVFAAGVFLVVIFALTASTMFPREHRPAALRSPLGGALLYLSIVAVAVLAAHTVWFAVEGVRWYFAVISAGLVVLFAPGLHDVLSAELREGVLGLVLGALLNIGLHAAIVSPVLP